MQLLILDWSVWSIYISPLKNKGEIRPDLANTLKNGGFSRVKKLFYFFHFGYCQYSERYAILSLVNAKKVFLRTQRQPAAAADNHTITAAAVNEKGHREMTDYIIIIGLACFWGGVALWLNWAERKNDSDNEEMEG